MIQDCPQGSRNDGRWTWKILVGFAVYKIVSSWTFQIFLTASRLPACRNGQDLAQYLNSCTIQFTNVIHQKSTKWGLNVDVTKMSMKWDIPSAEEIIQFAGNWKFKAVSSISVKTSSHTRRTASHPCPALVLQEIFSVCYCSSPFDPSDGSTYVCAVCILSKCVHRGPDITKPGASQPPILNKSFPEHSGGWHNFL